MDGSMDIKEDARALYTEAELALHIKRPRTRAEKTAILLKGGHDADKLKGHTDDALAREFTAHRKTLGPDKDPTENAVIPFTGEGWYVTADGRTLLIVGTTQRKGDLVLYRVTSWNNHHVANIIDAVANAPVRLDER